MERISQVSFHTTPHLSIIIPAYNEGGRIGPTLDAVRAFIMRQSYPCEIIVVDDGSTDTTVAVVSKKVNLIPQIKLLKLPANKGKGAAVRAGMLAAKGNVRLFMDADNSTSIEQVDKLLPFLSQGYGVVIGSRRTAGAVITVKQAPMRDFLGWMFRLLAHIIVPLDVQDSQNGFKLFSREAAENTFRKLVTNGWSFDVEILVLAHKMSYRVREVPIVWINDGRSKIKAPQMVRMLIDLLLIRIRNT